MTLMPSGSGGVRSPLDDLIQLLAQSGAGGSPSPYGGSDQPAGLFGSGYRAFMAQPSPAQLVATGAPVGDVDSAQAAAPSEIQSDSFGDFDWAPTVRAASARLGSGDPGAIQFAYNDANCPTCHRAPPTAPQLPSPTQQALPPLHLSDTLRNLFAAPLGVDLLPAPLSGVVTAGQIAGALSGPQASQAPNTGVGGRRKPRDFGQCEVQFANDQTSCDAISPYDLESRRCCWDSRNVRKDYCNRNGGLTGYPPLSTWWDDHQKSCYPQP